MSDLLSKVIAQARRRHGWTQLQLARRLHLKQSAISQWESGKAIPTITHRIDLARTLGLPLALMFPEAPPGYFDVPRITLSERDQQRVSLAAKLLRMVS